MSTKILCVDDDASLLAGLQRNLRKQFSIDTATGGEQGLVAIAEQGPYAVVVADMQMPGMTGLQFLTTVERRAPETVRVMLTGNVDQKTAMDAVNEGHVFRFLTKPCSTDALAATLEAALSQHRLVTAEREILERTLNGTAKVLSEILATLDPAAFGLSQKLREGVLAYLRYENVTPTWDLELAAMLCQIGYVTVPPHVLRKFRDHLALSAEEKVMLARVPRTGSELLANIPRLDGVAKIVLYQNKHFDGRGFPADATKHEEIPLGARVLKVLTDLLTLEAQGFSRRKALAELHLRAGTYDPGVLASVSACFGMSPEIVQESSRAERVSLRALRVNHLLVEKIETLDGVMLVGAGTLVTPMLLEKLRNFATVIGIREPILVE